jgi:UDP-glucosyl transferase 73C
MLKEPLENWLSMLEKLPTLFLIYVFLGLQMLHQNSTFQELFSMEFLASHSCAHININLSKLHERVDSMSTLFVVPDIIEFTKAQLLEAINQDSKALKEAIVQFKESELSAQGILVNTFEELEKNYVIGYENIAEKVWCIGPFCLHDKLT